MKKFAHWTPTYVKDRIAEVYYQKTHPGYPWLTRKANDILESYLRKTDKGLELGSGRSTIWLAQRVGTLVSVEHHEAWHAKVRTMLDDARATNVEYLLKPMEGDEASPDHAYVRVVEGMPPESLDFVLVDGVYRDWCALRARAAIRPGGIMIIDNVNWFLPSDSRSPASRYNADGPQGERWMEVDQALSDWRRIWTSSGVTDTAIYFKPCA
jgi:predicted O-methyltransferase YrrM